MRRCRKRWLEWGLRDEVFSPLLLGSEGFYDDRIATVPLRALSGTAATRRPLGIRVPKQLPPSASRFALALRAAGRAAILGAPIETRTAELSSAELAGRVVYHRSMTLLGADGPLPDRVLPDVPSSESVSPDDVEERARLVAGLLDLRPPDGPPLAPLAGEMTRERLVPLPNESELPDDDADLGTRLAALLVAHGAARQFFAFWSVVEDDFDPRLEDVVALARTEEDTREALAGELGALALSLRPGLPTPTVSLAPWSSSCLLTPSPPPSTWSSPYKRRTVSSSLAIPPRVRTATSPGSSSLAPSVSPSPGSRSYSPTAPPSTAWESSPRRNAATP